jgi:hypothetical protein
MKREIIKLSEELFDNNEFFVEGVSINSELILLKI